MLTREQNDLLTRVGPGTPGGALLRRYWQPVALSAELPIGGAPLPVTVMGEELVLFRDETGAPGLLGLHCSHRGADLSYGRVEDGGIRCIYHGWLFDRTGRCLEQPGEPPGSTFHERIRHRAYPCHEVGGAVFAYLGPGDPPLFPAYEFLHAPERQLHVNKVFHDCNYLQANEGNIDPVHLSYLHVFRQGIGGSAYMDQLNSLTSRDVAPTLEVEETDFGLRIYAVRASGPDECYVRVTNFIYPNLAAFPAAIPNGYSVNWHVPIDDTTHWKYMFNFAREAPVDKELMERMFFGDQLTPDHRFKRNRTNRYLQDRAEMRDRSYIGLGGNFVLHDLLATEGQGAIQDRTTECTATSDRAIVMERTLLLRAIRAVQEGAEAPHVIRSADANRLPHLGALEFQVPRSTDWKRYVQDRIEEARRLGLPGPLATSPSASTRSARVGGGGPPA